MALRIFSKRHPESAKDVFLKPAVRQRIWYLFSDSDPYSDAAYGQWDLCYEGLGQRLLREHGWQELRVYRSRDEWEKANPKEFVLGGVPRFVLDATEIFYDLLTDERVRRPRSSANPSEYQEKLNIVFEESNLPWRMLEGRIIRIDSKWLEAEIHARAAELLSVRGFEGALAEFQQARSDLSTGDYKSAMHAANLAMESTIKALLGVAQEKPGALLRKLIDSGIVPNYHEGFLRAFEEHILRSVAIARNVERGVGHGQGAEISEPAKSLAELAVNLSGVLILYLLKRSLEMNPVSTSPEGESGSRDDEVPF